MRPEDMAFPMWAIGKVSLGRAEYAPGEVFDAKRQTNADYLQARGAATPYLKQGGDAPDTAPEVGKADGAEGGKFSRLVHRKSAQGPQHETKVVYKRRRKRE